MPALDVTLNLPDSVERALSMLLSFADHGNHKLNLILEEITRMATAATNLATNDDALTAAVNDLITADAADMTAIQSEIATLKAAVFVPGADPAITDAISKIEALVAAKKADTAASLAALAPTPAPPAPVAADPTPAPAAPVSTDPAPADPAPASSTTDTTGTAGASTAS